MDLKQKLAQVQASLKAKKTKTNEYSPSKFKYRSAEDILEAVKPLLTEVGLVQTMTDEIFMIGDRYYVKATVTVSDLEKEESISVSAFAREAESKKGFDEAQITGSASSYARKYAMNGMYSIDDGDDPDRHDNTQVGASKKEKPNNEQKTKKSSSTAPDLQTVLKQAYEKGIEKEQVVALWKKQYGEKANTKSAVQIKKMLDIIDLVEEWSGTDLEVE